MPKLSSIPTILAGVAAAAALLVGSPAAYAAPGTNCAGSTFVIASPFDQNFLVNAGGATVTPVGGSGTFACIQQQDKLFSNLDFGALPGTAEALLNFATISGVDTHNHIAHRHRPPVEHCDSPELQHRGGWDHGAPNILEFRYSADVRFREPS